MPIISTGQITITDLMDGLNARLSSESHVLPADTGGNVTSFVGCATTMSVYLGAINDTANWSFSASPSSGLTGTLVGNTYSVTALSEDSGFVDITATKAGQPNLTARFSVAKARTGSTGLSSALVYAYKRSATTLTGSSYINSNLTSTAWGTTAAVAEIAWNGTVFCAVGANGQVATSTDGVTWTYQAGLTAVWGTGSIASANTIVWNGTVFCVGGNSGKIATSPDGVTWTNQTGLSSTSWGAATGVLSIIWTGSSFYAVGVAQKAASSPDGVTWTFQNSLLTVVPAATNINSVAWTGSFYCAVGGAGTVATSTDGVTWTDYTTQLNATTWGTAACWAVVWTGSALFMGGSNGKIATSTNGSSWTSLSGLLDAGWDVNASVFSLTYQGGAFIALGNNGQVAYSTNGYNWTLITVLAQSDWGTTATGQHSVFVNNKFVLVGNAAKIVTLTLGNSPGAVVYSFTTNAITTATLENGWSKTIPSGTDPLYLTSASTKSTTSTGTVSAADWSPPALWVKNGSNGIDGIDGIDGTNPTVYELGLSAAVIARSSSNVLAPSSLVVSGFSTTASTKSAYSGRFKIYEDGALKYTSSADQATYSYTPSVATVGIIKTELYLAGGTTTLLDTQEVPVVVSGSSAMTFSLTNSAYPIPADTSGAVATYVGSGTSIQVLEGSELYTYVATLGTTAKTFTIGTPTLSVANAITVGARSGATTTTAVVAQHSAMSNSVEAVVISYPLTYIRGNGATGTQTVTQSITKVKSGTLGIRGSRTLYSTNSAYISTYDFDGAGTITAGAASYAAKATELIAAATAGTNPTTPINGDTVTFTNGSLVAGQGYVYTITHNGTAWLPPGTVLDGSLLVTGSVTAGKIDSNGLTVRDNNGKLLLGSGGLAMQGLSGNLLRSSGFVEGIAGYGVSYYSTTAAPAVGWNHDAAYSLRGTGLAHIVVNGTPALNQVFDFRDISTTGAVPVTPGTRYEAHVLLNAHRCEGYVLLVWLTSTLAYITEVAGNVITYSSEVYDLTQMRQSGVFAVAPENARFCYVVARGRGNNSGANPYLFIKNMYLGQASAGQEDYTPYAPGVGMSQITAGNATTYIADAAIGSAKIASLDANKINAGTISVGLNITSTDGLFKIDFANKIISISV